MQVWVRRERGDAVLGNHLALVVGLDQRWLCDLGLGDGMRGPLPLVAGTHTDGALAFRMAQLSDGYWRFHNHGYGTPESFDFRDVVADDAVFDRQNRFLQIDPASYFILNAEVVRMGPDHAVTLLGRVLRHASAKGVVKTVLQGPDQMAQVLDDHFGMRGVDVAAIWPKIMARHVDLFGE